MSFEIPLMRPEKMASLGLWVAGVAHELSNPLAVVVNNLFLVQGLVDERVHPEQMLQLHQALRLKGVPTELVMYPREPHGLLERQHQLDFMRRVIAAFDRYVKPATPPAT